MNTKQVALYARVSSEQQAEAKTIESQLAEIRMRIAADGFDLTNTLEFVDEGYSGSTVVRPALERLRDVAAAGGIDRLYVHCPDRFARNYAYQVLLLDELTQRGVEVIFLNRPLGQTPEDQLLLQVQGVIAEYERAKFLERSRRGKRHAAQEGHVCILCSAPYGYRYVNKQEGGGEARFDIVFDESRVVQQVFTWVGQERCTINDVCRRLHQAGVRTRTGKEHWDHKTIWDMLKNPAYKGEAAFGKTRWTPVGPRLRAPRGRPTQSRRGYSGKDAPKEEWITIPVPTLVDPTLFEAVQEQLEENKQRARIPEKGSRYVLQGLLVCAQCGYAYCGRTNDARNAYYRCAGAMNLPRHGFERLCRNKELRMDQADAAVWQEVCRLLEEPERLEQEYRQRLRPQQQPNEHEGLEAQMGKLRRGIARLIDSYADGLIDKQEFEPRVTRLRERMQHLEEQQQRLKEESEVEEELRLILGHLETFAAKVNAGLQQADFSTRREIIRALVKRVEVDEQQIRVVFRVSPTWSPSSSEETSHNWQHCGRRVATRSAHNHVGEMSAIEPCQPRVATVVADENAVICKLSEPHLAEVGQLYPDIWRYFARELVRRLAQRNAFVTPLREHVRVFIISSTEALPIAREIQSHFEHDNFSVEIWTDGVFTASSYPIESLEKAVDDADFAIAIAQPDDLTNIRGLDQQVPRDNVIFELGIFIGRLGRNRTLLLEPRGETVKLPTDLSGLLTISYRYGDPKALPSLLGPACNRIRKIVNDLGPRI